MANDMFNKDNDFTSEINKAIESIDANQIAKNIETLFSGLGDILTEGLGDIADGLGLDASELGLDTPKRRTKKLEKMERVCKFIKEAETYYLATIERDQPRVRPFGTIHIYDNKLYIQTGRSKKVSRQLAANPKCEICAYKEGTWLRLAGTLVEDKRIEAKQSMLDAYPSLQSMYKADDNNTQVLYFTKATATFSSFAGEPEVLRF